MMKICIEKAKSFILLFLLTIHSSQVMASDIASSKIATGTQKLIGDATGRLMIIAPTVTVLLIIYYLIRKSMTDEMEHKKWNSQIAVALISCVGAVVAAVLVNVLVSYYQ